MKPTVDPLLRRAASVLFSISFSFLLQLPLPPYVLSGTAGPMLVELCSFCFHHTCLHGLRSLLPCLKISWQATPLPDPRGSWPPRSMHLRAPLHPTNLPPRLASHTLLLTSCLLQPFALPSHPSRAASSPSPERLHACSGLTSPLFPY